MLTSGLRFFFLTHCQLPYCWGIEVSHWQYYIIAHNKFNVKWNYVTGLNGCLLPWKLTPHLHPGVYINSCFTSSLSFSSTIIHPIMQLEQPTASLARNPSWHGLPSLFVLGVCWVPDLLELTPELPGRPWKNFKQVKVVDIVCLFLIMPSCWP